ncbi:MAG TPA: allantoicase [Sandaracinaceae bacterium LLY-WYZ-13_1]|nr:allantoicase [Sandaracinaceae bacterium LLY-WYZ-13_1]
MSDGSSAATFGGLIDLAAEALGGHAVSCSDDFFASMHNLVKPGRGVFVPDRYTDRGKWMDGWESRRKRGPGHDWCVVSLGARGVIRALDVDTNHFLGNHPPFASVEAARVPSDDDLAHADWVEILPQSPLRPGAQNLFTVRDPNPFTHVRLHIYPDGGVARLRVWGEVESPWSTPALDEETHRHVTLGERDLAAVVNGGKALACSDAFFGPMDNLLLPGRAENMGGGWETRRRRPAPGHDWILIRLGDVGTASVVEVDTLHFKGNHPDRCAIRGILAPGAPLTELLDPSAEWSTLLPEAELAAHRRHFFSGDLAQLGPYSHLRLEIFPDGGVSRLRVWGHRDTA